jgi:hypothetical protein
MSTTHIPICSLRTAVLETNGNLKMILIGGTIVPTYLASFDQTTRYYRACCLQDVQSSGSSCKPD